MALTGRLAAVAVLVTVAACGVQLYRATPGPGFRVGPEPGRDSAAVRALLRYAGALEFDTTKGAGDDRVLHVGACPGATCSFGPRAEIHPERGAHQITHAERGAGRVIARLVNNDTIDYPKFALRARSTVYWWVDSTAGGWRSVFFSSVPGVAPLVSDLEVDRHQKDYRWYQAMAKWLWDPRDEMAWSTCEMGGCCRSTGLATR
jgi:hypothetical protein